MGGPVDDRLNGADGLARPPCYLFASALVMGETTGYERSFWPHQRVNRERIC